MHERGDFRADLEGLRGVAIALVVAFHAGVPGLTGGFVGVDVFFVLSGFLITGIILHELTESRHVDLVRFYARRARRLLPAAFVALLATLAVSAVILPPLRAEAVASDGVAAALYVSNIRFALQAADYFQSQFPPSPLLHYWSLGVEEQFYLVWPALLLVAARFGGTRGVAIAVGVVSVASLILAVWLTGVSEPWAFFSLPARAWQLGLGAGLAIAATHGWSLGRWATLAGGIVGLCAITAASVLIGPGTPYPGLVALLPAGGAALIIAAGLGSSRGISGALAVRPLRWLGRISYSLYLWHWPILVLPAAFLGHVLGPRATVILVGASVVIAALSYRFVEQPVRLGRLARLPSGRTLALAGTATVIVVIASFGLSAVAAVRPWQVRADNGPPVGGTTPHLPVPADLVPSLKAAADDGPASEQPCIAPYPIGVTFGRGCVLGDPSGPLTMVLLGDSHGSQWFPALERIAVEDGWRLISLTKSSCAFMEGQQVKDDQPFTDCSTWVDAVLDALSQERPALVVVSNFRYTVLARDGVELSFQGSDPVWIDRFGSTIARLKQVAGTVAVIGDTPYSNVSVPACLSASLDDSYRCGIPRAATLLDSRHDLDRQAAEANGGRFIDPTDWLCPTDPCPAVMGNILVYRDMHHMTATFAATLAPPLRAALGDFTP